MKIAIMQPYFFPYIGYFQLLNYVDKFIIYDDVNYINKGWINRNKIIVSNQINYINVPLKKASQNKKINEIVISYDHDWVKKILTTIKMNYSKSKNFNTIFLIIENLLKKKYSTISDLNFHIINSLVKYLDIKTKIVKSSSIYQNQNLKGQDRILDICKKENASIYVNPIGGVHLYEKEKFSNNGIEIQFLKTKEFSKYSSKNQINLSIIDMLFNLDKRIISSQIFSNFAIE